MGQSIQKYKIVCLPQLLLGPFLNTLSLLILEYFEYFIIPMKIDTQMIKEAAMESFLEI